MRPLEERHQLGILHEALPSDPRLLVCDHGDPLGQVIRPGEAIAGEHEPER